jgi:hypothetical protein
LKLFNDMMACPRKEQITLTNKFSRSGGDCVGED